VELPTSKGTIDSRMLMRDSRFFGSTTCVLALTLSKAMYSIILRNKNPSLLGHSSKHSHKIILLIIFIADV
jgi:hypothetical protein